MKNKETLLNKSLKPSWKMFKYYLKVFLKSNEK